MLLYIKNHHDKKDKIGYYCYHNLHSIFTIHVKQAVYSTTALLVLLYASKNNNVLIQQKKSYKLVVDVYGLFLGKKRSKCFSGLWPKKSLFTCNFIFISIQIINGNEHIIEGSSFCS